MATKEKHVIVVQLSDAEAATLLSAHLFAESLFNGVQTEELTDLSVAGLAYQVMHWIVEAYESADPLDRYSAAKKLCEGLGVAPERISTDELAAFMAASTED